MSSTPSRTDELESIAYELWIAPEVAELDGWRLRFAHGITGRANSVWPNGEGVLPLEEKLRRAEAWYRARSASVLFQVTDAARPRELASVLESHGYERRHAPVSVQLARLDDVVAATRGDAVLSDRAGDAWLALWAEARGFERRDVARKLLEAGDVAFASVDDLAVGRGVAVGDWLGITSMVTVPSARRRGLARAILHALARWGAGRGCTRAMLQVDSSNEPALALYAGVGFQPHHDYRYWILP